jgi:hypothetical protein
MMARAKVNYTVLAKNFRTLVYWAHGGVCSMAGKAYCRPEERKLVMEWARDLGLLPPDSFYRPIQSAGRPVPQIEATAKLASDPGPDEIRRRRIASGPKTI